MDANSPDFRAAPGMARERVSAEALAPDIFAHFVVKTSRYEAMREWYKTVLNAHIVFEGGGLCFLTYDDEHHRLAIRNTPGLLDLDERSCGLLHFAYTYRSLRGLLSTYLRLKQHGIVPYWTINHGPTVSMYFHDPDGASIELQVDNFATKEEVSRFFSGDAFRDNPIGVNFDPEEMIRQYEAGVPEDELKRRPPLPHGKKPDDMRPRRAEKSDVREMTSA